MYGKVRYISKRYLTFGDKKVAPGEVIPEDHGFSPAALHRWVKYGRLAEVYSLDSTITREEILDHYVKNTVKKKPKKK